MINRYLKSICTWLKAKALEIRDWLNQQVPKAYEKSKESAQWFCSEPLSKAEYALLKRVSTIVGTALAMYLVVTAGIIKILMITVLCAGLTLLLHRFFGEATPGASI